MREQESQRSQKWIARNHPNNIPCQEYIMMLCDKRYCIKDYEIKSFNNDGNALFIYNNEEYYIIKVDLEWIELKVIKYSGEKTKIMRNFDTDNCWNEAIKFVRRAIADGE